MLTFQKDVDAGSLVLGFSKLKFYCNICQMYSDCIVGLYFSDGVDIPSNVHPFIVDFLKESSASLSLGKIHLVLITKCGENLQLSPSGDIASISFYGTEIKTIVDHSDNRVCNMIIHAILFLILCFSSGSAHLIRI